MASCESVPYDPWRWQRTELCGIVCAGAIAGTVVEASLFPLDCLKTRLQAGCTWGSLRQVGCLAFVRSLYSGVGVTVFSAAPGSALFFAVYESSRARLINSPSVSMSGAYASAISGGFATCTQVALLAPSEICKQRLQARQYATLTEALKSLRLRQVCSGFRATATRDVSFSMLQYPIYEDVKGRIVERRDAPLSPPECALCGAFASSVAAAVTTPLDVCKTRMMLKSRDGPQSGIVTHFRAVVARRGVRGLFTGLVPRCLWSGSGGLIFLGSYEQAKAIMFGPAGFAVKPLAEAHHTRETHRTRGHNLLEQNLH